MLTAYNPDLQCLHYVLISLLLTGPVATDITISHTDGENNILDVETSASARSVLLDGADETCGCFH